MNVRATEEHDRAMTAEYGTGAMLGVVSRHVSPLWLESFSGALEDRPGTLRGGIGWGVAGYLGPWTVSFGSGTYAGASGRPPLDSALRKAVTAKSRVIITRQFDPFPREEQPFFISGDWIFCGEGRGGPDDRLQELFRLLVSRLDCRSVSAYESIVREALEEAAGPEPLRFLMSNGNQLLAYRDAPDGASAPRLLTARTWRAILFCTEDLPGFEWMPVPRDVVTVVSRHEVAP